ncbi:MAG: efflux RND transporter periplasmic adaptor subunit, partial [Burkholderiaceae bacterium]
MKLKHLTSGLVAAAVLAAAGYCLYTLGLQHRTGQDRAAPPAAVAAALQAGDVDPGTGKTVLYWHDPIVPGQRFDRPGKSPFMDMMLVPVYAEGGAEPGQVSVTPRVEQNLGVRTADVIEEVLTTRVD